MAKWLIIGFLVVALVIGVAEFMRRQSADNSTTGGPQSNQVEGNGAAAMRHLSGDNLNQSEEERARQYSETELSDDQEFDRAEEVLDSREESLDDAKNKVRVIYGD